jgi:hypothetical protein
MNTDSFATKEHKERKVLDCGGRAERDTALEGREVTGQSCRSESAVAAALCRRTP